MNASLATIFKTRENEDTNKVVKIEPTNEGAVTISQLNTANLISNAKYQRDIDRKKVSMIVDNFNPHKLGVIKVSYRDGKYYVYDGQHRIMALKAINKGQDCIVPCEIHYGLTYQDEARLFAGQYDGTTKVDIVYQNRALYEANDETILKLKAIVESVGLLLPFTKTKVDNNIIAIAKLKTMYRNLTNEELVRVLSLIKNTWSGISTSLDTEILGGMYIFFNVYKTEIVDETFIKNLKKVDPILIKRTGKADYSAKGDLKYAKVIWDSYNTNLSKNRLPYKFKG